jgi:hypothetical protein
MEAALYETIERELEVDQELYHSTDIPEIKDLVKDVLTGTHIDKLKDKYSAHFDVVEKFTRKNWIWEDRAINYMTIVDNYLTNVDVYASDSISNENDLEKRLENQVDKLKGVYETFSDLKNETLNKRFKRIKNKERGERVSTAFDMIQDQLDDQLTDYLVDWGEIVTRDVRRTPKRSDYKAEDYESIAQVEENISSEVRYVRVLRDDLDSIPAENISDLEDLNPEIDEKYYDLADGPVTFGTEQVEEVKKSGKDLAREWEDNIIAGAKKEVHNNVVGWLEEMNRSSNPKKYLQSSLDSINLIGFNDLISNKVSLQELYAEELSFASWYHQIEGTFADDKDRQRKVDGVTKAIKDFTDRFDVTDVFEKNYSSLEEEAFELYNEIELNKVDFQVDTWFREMSKEVRPSNYLESKLADLNFVPGTESRINKIYAGLLTEKLDDNLWKTVLEGKTEKAGLFRKKHNAYDTVSKVIENYTDKWDVKLEEDIKDEQMAEVIEFKPRAVDYLPSWKNVAASIAVAACTVAFPAQAGDGSLDSVNRLPTDNYLNATFNYTSRGLLDHHQARFGVTSVEGDVIQSNVNEHNVGFIGSLPITNKDSEEETISLPRSSSPTSLVNIESEQFEELRPGTQVMVHKSQAEGGFLEGEVFASGNGDEMEIATASFDKWLSVKRY